MLIVDICQYDDTLLTVKFNYYRDYIRRIRNIEGAVFVPDYKFWTIPRNSLDYFESIFCEEIIYKTPEWVIKKLPAPDYMDEFSKIKYKFLPACKIPLMKYQEVGTQFIIDRLSTLGFAVCADSCGLGKALSNATNVLTDRGWVRICDLALTDKVYGYDGKPYDLLGIYPQGVRQVYKVTFSDGSYAVCDKEHLWSFDTFKMRDHLKRYNQAKTHRRPRYMTNTTEYIYEHRLYINGRNNIYIPMTSPVEFKAVELPMDPYTFGRRIHSRSIPKEYLWNSVENRAALLAGIIDTHGQVIKSYIVIRTPSLYLANEIKFLVHSLGGTINIKRLRAIPPHIYRLSIRLPTGDILSRSNKRKTVPDKDRRFPMRSVDSVIFCGYDKCTCIQVASPDNLFIIDDFVVTHNTPQALASMQHYVYTGKVQSTLIVCKKSLKTQWQRDGVNKFIGDSIPSYIVSGIKKERLKLYKEFGKVSGPKILITNYHSIMNDVSDMLKLFTFDMVIIDEAHKVATRTGVMNNAIMDLIKKQSSNPYVLFLTGTPILSTPEDIFGIVQIANKNIFPAWKEFSSRYIIYDYEARFTRLVGYKYLNELREIVQKFTIRRTEHEVSVELPEMTTSLVHIDMDDIQIEINDSLKASIKMLQDDLDSCKDSDKKKTLNDLTKALGAARQAAASDPRLFLLSKSKMMVDKYGGMVPDKYKMSPKTESLLDLIQNIIDSGSKVIVFTKFERAVRMLAADIETALKIRVVTYSGKVEDDTRDANVQAFWSDPDVLVFVSNDAGAEGLNLQCANYVINYDQPDNPGIKEQRFGRVRRIGSTYKHVTMYDLISVDSMDQEKLDSLSVKDLVSLELIGMNSVQSAFVKKQLSE